ncbi:MAG: gliding motility-associated ABC transporter substrate-binding protein GldG [Bacteroidales bacterium]|nr:gliding motility-associated ABC transporter substrate-binding protein GldG [Bacteroidales bacterium]
MKFNFKKNKKENIPAETDNPISKDISKRRGVRKQNIREFVLGLIFIILLNFIGSYVYYRLDLTSEKRYTLSQSTKDLLKNLNDVVYFKIYLEGDFPASFKRLRNETREMLDEFRAYSNNIEYEFVDPLENIDNKNKKEVIRQLMEKGLVPTQIQVKEGNGTATKIIFPCASVIYKNRELPLQLLKTQINVPSSEILNNSVQALEYEISNVLRKHTLIFKQKVGFIEGHGELDSLLVDDIAKSLSEYYTVNRIGINGRLKSLKNFKAIIIAKPDSVFSDKDKFIVDQFIMNGGKVLWLVDRVYANMDSLRNTSETIGFPLDLNLDDQLFKYGVRINTNLIQDLYCMKIPLVTGFIGKQPQMSFMPWYYFPLIAPSTNHPVVNNLNVIKFEFASTIDTINVPDIKKTILLTSSKFSRAINAPARISLEMMKKNPDEINFNSPYQTVAVLLEGKFTSVFKNRLPAVIMEDKEIAFKEKSPLNKMIIISDGDVIKSQIGVENGVPYAYPLGYDRYTNATFGNKNFIMNVMNYLCDDSGLISIRARELKMRLLDIAKIEKQKVKWQIINLCLPVILVLIFGLLQNILRRRKYTL